MDEKGQVVLIGEDHSPVTDPKAVNLIDSMETEHIALAFLAKLLDGSKDSLPSDAV